MKATPLLHWIEEREAIRIRRASGAPWPWTDDPILRVWSFCNVRREYDRATKWIAANWRDPHVDNPDLWFAMVVARLVNWPDTLAEIGFPVPWNPEQFLRVMADRKQRGKNCYGPAYKIGTAGRSMEKPPYQAQCVFTPMWERRAKLRPRTDDSLLGWHARLMQHDGMASFMAAQVVADMKYVAPLRSARDWMTFAASGPGSKRGLNRVLGRPVDAAWREDDWRAAIRRLHEAVAPELERIGIERLHAQDLQNCLCEVDKFERVRLNEGKPKRRFVPHDDGGRP
jgi:alpha-glutamyl/putrescinyl thymine pyrophosphorylase clade 1